MTREMVKTLDENEEVITGEVSREMVKTLDKNKEVNAGEVAVEMLKTLDKDRNFLLVRWPGKCSRLLTRTGRLLMRSCPGIC